MFILKIFSEISKEEVLQRVAALEFDHFLKYYEKSLQKLIFPKHEKTSQQGFFSKNQSFDSQNKHNKISEHPYFKPTISLLRKMFFITDIKSNLRTQLDDSKVNILHAKLHKRLEAVKEADDSIKWKYCG